MQVCNAQAERSQPAEAGPYRLSLVIPAWNEQETIRQAVQEAAAALASTTADYEIVVVDDGSTDDTAAIVSAEAAANPRVRLVRHPHNRGYGASLRTGFQAATQDLVAFTDADCQFDLGDLAYMLPLTRRYDVTCGYRIDRQDPAQRRFFSWGYNTLVTLLLGSQVRDLDCALKVFHRDQLPQLLPESDNFFANTEMLTTARLRGLSVVEVGVRHRPRAAGQSKVSWLDVPRTLGQLLPFWWSRLLFPAPDPDAPRLGGWFWAALVFLAILAGALLFPSLSYPLFEPDEGRYAEIGREMAARGDWVVPTLNHQPYYDKPPLFYWLVAGSFRLFGVSEWAARLVPTGAAFLTVLATFWFGTRIVGARAAFLAALTLTLMGGFVQTARLLTLDAVLSLFVTLALFSALESVRGGRLRRGWWVVASGCCALGVLTKGPIAFALFAPPLFAYVRLSRQATRPTRGQWAAFVGLLFVLIAPWFILITVHDPQFAYQFVIDHHLKRFFLGTEHPAPIWYYLPVLMAGCLPWSLLLFPVSRFLLTRSPEARALRTRALGFFVLWAGWCVLFFTLSRGKLPLYLLPALPAIALLLGGYLEKVVFSTSLTAFGQKARSRVPWLAVAVLAMMGLVIGICAFQLGLTSPRQCLVQGGLYASCLVGVALWGRKLSSKAGWGVCAVLMVALILEVGHHLAPLYCSLRSPLAQSPEVAALLREGDTAVACHGQEWGSITFRARGDVFDLSKRSPEKLAAFLASHPRTLVVTSRAGVELVRRLLPAGQSIREVGTRGYTVIALVSS